jgi:hypothetical protein
VGVIAALTGKRVSIVDAQRATGEPANGFTSIAGGIRMFARYGLTAVHGRSPMATADWVCGVLQYGITPVLLVHYPALRSSYRYDYAHFVTAVGFDQEYIYINDPLQTSGAWACKRAHLNEALMTPSIWVGRNAAGERIEGRNLPGQSIYIPSPRLPVRDARVEFDVQMLAARRSIKTIQEMLD